MTTYPVITTKAKGFGALSLYFAIFGENRPKGFPVRGTAWVDGARYDAPHGSIIVYSDHRWEATYSFEPVAGDDTDAKTFAEAFRHAIPNATVTVE